jgi:hypothetical protein
MEHRRSGSDGRFIRYASCLPAGGGNWKLLLQPPIRGHASFWLALLGSVGGMVLVMLLEEPLNLILRFGGFLGVVPPILPALVGQVGRRKWGTDEQGKRG